MRTEQDVSIFDFDSVDAYLSAVFASRKKRRRGFSLRAWALRLGLKASDSGNLSRVLCGRRELSRQMATKVARDLSLGPNELAYFELLSMGRERLSSESLRRLRNGLRRLAVLEDPFGDSAETPVTETVRPDRPDSEPPPPSLLAAPTED